MPEQFSVHSTSGGKKNNFITQTDRAFLCVKFSRTKNKTRENEKREAKLDSMSIFNDMFSS